MTPGKVQTAIKKNIPRTLFKIILIGLLLLFTVLFNRALSAPPLEAVQWLLYPVVILVSAATGIPFTWVEQTGYINHTGTIVINQTCSGLDFLVVLIIINAVLYIPGSLPAGKSAARFLLLLLPAYAATLIANAARVVCSLFLSSFAGSVAWLQEGSHLAHQACGIILFFSFILLYHYSITRWTLWKKQKA